MYQILRQCDSHFLQAAVVWSQHSRWRGAQVLRRKAAIQPFDESVTSFMPVQNFVSSFHSGCLSFTTGHHEPICGWPLTFIAR